MLFDPNKMPEFKTSKDKFNRPPFRSILQKNKVSIARKGKAALVDMRQKAISKHKQPSTYIEAKVEKRKS